MILGASTPSFDMETAIDATFQIDHITTDEIYAATLPFTGDIEQYPPAHSAVKVNGERLYCLLYTSRCV